MATGCEKVRFEPMRARDMELLAVGAAPATHVVLLGRASKPITPEFELLDDEELEVELDAELVLEELEDTELLLVEEELELVELDTELVLEELEETELDAEELDDELIDD
jgi:hypothetical protein